MISSLQIPLLSTCVWNTQPKGFSKRDTRAWCRNSWKSLQCKDNGFTQGTSDIPRFFPFPFTDGKTVLI